MWIHVSSTTRDIISFNVQTQLFPFKVCRVKRFSKLYQNWRDSVKDVREKGQKKNVTMMQEFPWKSCFTIHLQSLSTNPKILKAFPKTFPVFWQNTQEWMAFTLSYFVWQQLKVHVSWWSDKKRQSQHLTKRLCQDRFKERTVSLYQRKVWSHDRNVRQCSLR